jgi:hypothetical protein
MTKIRQRCCIVLLVLVSCFAGTQGTFAESEEEPQAGSFIPQPGQFPPVGTGTYLAGELVIVDPINRRGGLRLEGNGNQVRYARGPIHYFALLPYGTIHFCGAPAELRDIPIGTLLHGYFFLPPVGEEKTIPPLPEEKAKLIAPQNHALSLEDDFSFYQRQGQAWKIESIEGAPTYTVDITSGKVTSGDVSNRGKLKVVSSGGPAKDGITGDYTFEIDGATRVWQGGKAAGLGVLAPGQIVQLNLTWAPGWRDDEFCVADIWLDEASRESATELQRRRHIRYQRYHWLAGWVDSVEHQDIGGGVITITLFGGMDPSLYSEFQEKGANGIGVAVAETTLRTYWHNNDKKFGTMVGWKEITDPPPGSSGYQIRIRVKELLNGYRPHRIVRMQCRDWGYFRLPSEERLKTVEERDEAATLGLPK